MAKVLGRGEVRNRKGMSYEVVPVLDFGGEGAMATIRVLSASEAFAHTRGNAEVMALPEGSKEREVAREARIASVVQLTWCDAENKRMYDDGLEELQQLQQDIPFHVLLHLQREGLRIAGLVGRRDLQDVVKDYSTTELRGEIERREVEDSENRAIVQAGPSLAEQIEAVRREKEVSETAKTAWPIGRQSISSVPEGNG